jgi:hypothetical protein
MGSTVDSKYILSVYIGALINRASLAGLESPSALLLTAGHVLQRNDQKTIPVALWLKNEWEKE